MLAYHNFYINPTLGCLPWSAAMWKCQQSVVFSWVRRGRSADNCSWSLASFWFLKRYNCFVWFSEDCFVKTFDLLLIVSRSSADWREEARPLIRQLHHSSISPHNVSDIMKYLIFWYIWYLHHGSISPLQVSNSDILNFVQDVLNISFSESR